MFGLVGVLDWGQTLIHSGKITIFTMTFLDGIHCYSVLAKVLHVIFPEHKTHENADGPVRQTVKSKCERRDDIPISPFA